MYKTICEICGEEFIKKTPSDIKRTCGKVCEIKLRKKSNTNVGKILTKEEKFNQYHNKLTKTIVILLSYFKISFDEFMFTPNKYIKQAKKYNVIFKNNGISLKSIIKYKIKAEDMNG